MPASTSTDISAMNPGEAEAASFELSVFASMVSTAVAPGAEASNGGVAAQESKRCVRSPSEPC
eukprot:scaffold246721_cov48-Prasinocladus_malaysianus.AAC.1